MLNQEPEQSAQQKQSEQEACCKAADNSQESSQEAKCSCDCGNKSQEETVAAAEDDTRELVSENAKLRAQIAKLESEHKSSVEKLIRAVAEAENQKKRAEADVDKARKFGNEKILKALLPVVDSLELALQHSNRNDPAIKATVEGVENTVKLLLKELGNFGVEVINPVGEQFNPNLHQAISMVPSHEVKANHVAVVMQKGYTLSGRVVRPAMVMVSQGAPNSDSNGSSGNFEA